MLRRMEVGFRDGNRVPAQEVADRRVVAALIEIGLDGTAAEGGQVQVGLGIEPLGNGDGYRPFLRALAHAEGFGAERGFAPDLPDDLVAAVVPLAAVRPVVEGAVADAVEFQVEVAAVAV